jgi:hypothetical protein
MEVISIIFHKSGMRNLRRYTILLWAVYREWIYLSNRKQDRHSYLSVIGRPGISGWFSLCFICGLCRDPDIYQVLLHFL